MAETLQSFAKARPFLADVFAALLPAERVMVDAFAADHRWLANEGGGYVGRWQNEMAPYLVQPMRALLSGDHATVAVAGPGQSGKTSLAENLLLTAAVTDPADMLWYMQTDDGISAYVKGRINPMIDGHDELRSRLGLRPIDDSLHFKRFRGMNVEFLSATSSNLINKRAPRIIADEIDAYPSALGDVKVLLDVRRQTYGSESILLAMSHCDRARGIHPERGDWASGIMAIYADSDRRVWYWPCPHCGAWSSPAPIATRIMTLEYDADGSLDDVQASARLICPVNGCVIEDHHRRAMNLAAWQSPHGGWVGDGQEIAEDGTVTGELVRRDAAGFWIVGVMSPFIRNGIGGLARARVKAERDFEQTGEDATLREVMVKQFGVPYTPPKIVGSVDANDLADRAEGNLARGTVPEGVRFLTLAIDCQIAHFEWLLRGWGEHGESWVIDTGRIPADPATRADDWDGLLELADRRWPLADDSGRSMAIRAFGYDSQGAPGVTEQAYAAWTRWRKARRVRWYGTVGGRAAWSVIPTRGMSTPNAPRLQVVYPDTARKANVLASAGTVPTAQFNPNAFKDALAGQLKTAEPGAGFIHVPAALKSKEPPHAWFEQLVAEAKGKNGRWEKIAPSARNEALDLMVMSHVVAHLHGLSRLNWASPPGWAAPWDTNSLISAADAAVVAPAPSAGAGGTMVTTPAAADAGAAPSPANAVRQVGGIVQKTVRSLASRLA